MTLYISFLEIYNEKIYDLLNGAMFKLKQQSIRLGYQDPQGLKLKWN